MKSRETLLAEMRNNLRWLAEPLTAEGWTRAEITEISDMVRAILAADDGELLACAANWLAEMAAAPHRRRSAYQRRRMACCVVPAPSIKSAARWLDRQWRDKQSTRSK